MFEMKEMGANKLETYQNPFNLQVKLLKQL